MTPLRLVLFDLNGTLLDPSVMAGPPGGGDEDRALVAGALDDTIMGAMTLTLGGRYRHFAELLGAALERRLLAGRARSGPGARGRSERSPRLAVAPCRALTSRWWAMTDPTPSPQIRAGDDERERTVLALREHAARGRLDVDELDARIDAAFAARTRGELGQLLRDLPALDAPPASPPRRKDSRSAVAFKRQLISSLVLILFLVGIWAASGGGYFWPVWPALGLALAAGLHGAKVLWDDNDEEEGRERLPRGGAER